MPISSAARKKEAARKPSPSPNGSMYAAAHKAAAETAGKRAAAKATAADLIPASIPCHLPHGDLRPSPTNPRKLFSAPKLESLAASIRKVGIRQRLVVRPVAPRGKPAPRYEGGKWVGAEYFEIVAGERRWKAARLAKLAQVPVDAALLDDEQVAAIQLVENDERDDLLPSEQAAAYARLARTRTAEQIHEMTGRPLSVVRSILKLGRVPAELLAAVDEGRVPRVTAELVARIPGEESRRRCAMAVLAGKHYYRSTEPVPKPKPEDEPLTFRETKALIADAFQVQLKEAPFDRKALDLVPAAGGCEPCPKRAGNDAEATADGVRADMCLDPCCYRAKVEARNRQVVAEAKGGGRKLLTKAESQTLFTSWDNHLNYDAPYVDLAATCHEDRKSRTYRTLLAEHVPAAQVVIAVDHKSEPHELVEKKVAREALKKHHNIGHAGAATRGEAQIKQKNREQDQKAKAGRKAGLRANEIVAERMRERFAAASLPNLSAAVSLLQHTTVALVDATWADACRHVARRRGLAGDPSEALQDLARSLTTVADLLALVAELVAARKSAGWGSPYSGEGNRDKEFWSAWGIDRAELLQAAAAPTQAANGKGVRALAPPTPAPAARVTRPADGPERNGHARKTAEQQLVDMGLLTAPEAAEVAAGEQRLGMLPNFPVSISGALSMRGVRTVADLMGRVEHALGHEPKDAELPAAVERVIGALGMQSGVLLETARDAVVVYLRKPAFKGVKP